MSHVEAESVDRESSIALLIEGLRSPNAYPGIEADSVEMRETHISWVFLVGDFAFKLKKPVHTPFLDYSTLPKRKHFCEEEYRLDQRYAADLYLGVVPITVTSDGPKVEGRGQPVEYAVKMRRFPDGALLSERMVAGTLTTDEVFALAERIADFHQSAKLLVLIAGHICLDGHVAWRRYVCIYIYIYYY